MKSRRRRSRLRGEEFARKLPLPAAVASFKEVCKQRHASIHSTPSSNPSRVPLHRRTFDSHSLSESRADGESERERESKAQRETRDNANASDLSLLLLLIHLPLGGNSSWIDSKFSFNSTWTCARSLSAFYVPFTAALCVHVCVALLHYPLSLTLSHSVSLSLSHALFVPVPVPHPQ